MMKRVYVIMSLLLLVTVVSFSQNITNKSNKESFITQKVQNGVLMKQGDAKLKVKFVNPAVVRVQYVPKGDFKDNETNVCIPRDEANVRFKIKENNKAVTLTSKLLKINIDKSTGAIQYLSSKGESLLKENQYQPRLTEIVPVEKTEYDESSSRIEKTANGDLVVSDVSSRQVVGEAVKAKQQFVWQDGEALYGLGSHQEDYMNLRGKVQYLYQHNMKATVPVLMSTKGYGLLFDAGSTMIFRDDAQGSFMEMIAVNQIDYYFMYGPELDQVVGEYRGLTGKVDMMPKYIFGYVQSKEKYPDEVTIDSVVTRFRQEQIPLDVIVQDWSYWKWDWWGHKKFREDSYPDPTRMIKNIHDKNTHYMLSLWPTASGDEAEEMGEKGYVLGRGIYDAYNPASRKMYWDNYVNKNLFSHGVDAWWCDGTEPIDADWNWEESTLAIANNPEARFKLNGGELNDLLGPMRANTFSLFHSQGIYENQRLTTNEKRVVNLTRSTYAGQQRYGTFVWNGDTKATWADFAQQIPSGLNYMATGSPYWTIDIGGFFVKSNGNAWFWQGDFENGTDDLGFREFYVRNAQFCQWLPMFRSHGTNVAREPWQFGKPGEPFYDSIIKQINLRYRLLPYTYSLAGMITNYDYTMTRLLAFDFREDTNVHDIKDQFMYGPSFMICPVTKPMYYEVNSRELIGVSKTRSVYMPKGTNWVDFWTGKKYEGGNIITADAPLDRIPVYVKQGSIVPMGPLQQYSSEKPDAPWEVRIYPGANATFTVYEDEGDNYNYENGDFAQFNLEWNDKKRTLTIGDRDGSFDNMVVNREFKIVIVGEGKATGIYESNSIDKVVNYDGNKINISL